MRVSAYRLHKASGQAIVSLNGTDHYLGKHDSPESRSKYESLIADHLKTRAKEKAKKARIDNDGPGYRLHARSGQAVVTISGHDYYLGVFNSKESKAKYHRLKAEWIASGKSPSFGVKPEELTVIEMMAAWVRFAKEYYGEGPSSELHRAVPVLKVLKTLYGSEPAVNFGPLQYEAVRVTLLEPYLVKRKGGTSEKKRRSRTYINSLMKRLRAVFRWAASKSLIPVSVHDTLKTVEPLKHGRTTAPELDPVAPVPDEIVDATLPKLNHVMKAMVEFQRLTGCRPGEVCKIKPSMVDRTADVWEVQLAKHKTAYRGRKRTVYAGTRAQAILAPFLLRGEDEFCFSPIEAEKRRRKEKHIARKTPLSCGNKPGSKIAKAPLKQPGPCYTRPFEALMRPSGLFCRQCSPQIIGFAAY
ncbi:MAG: site-specific integrase [Pirellulaceae bacterium]|nr:site-specific integrase [Pirellulaceae bacterium]